jgi:DNA-binding NarL/FixJ family response regulator
MIVDAHMVSLPPTEPALPGLLQSCHASHMSIGLIDCRSATRECLCRWFQQGSPDLRVVSASSAGDLTDLSGSVEHLHLILFNVGGSSVKEPETLGQITRLRQHLPCVPLMLLMDRDDMDEIVEAMARGVRGLITKNMALLATAAERNHRLEGAYCYAAGGCADRLDAGCDGIDR